MKKLLLITSALVFVLFSQSASAQSVSAKKSGWFVTIGGGGQVYYGESDTEASFSDRITPALDISVGKWMSPVWGARIQYNGLGMKGLTNASNPYSSAAYKDTHLYEQKFGYWNIHADLLFNLSAAICQYPRRFYELIPYGGIGYAGSYGKGDNENANSCSVSLNGGLLNKFRVCRSVDLYLDLRAVMLQDKLDKQVGGIRFDGAAGATLGVTYKF